MKKKIISCLLILLFLFASTNTVNATSSKNSTKKLMNNIEKKYTNLKFKSISKSKLLKSSKVITIHNEKEYRKLLNSLSKPTQSITEFNNIVTANFTSTSYKLPSLFTYYQKREKALYNLWYKRVQVKKEFTLKKQQKAGSVSYVPPLAMNMLCKYKVKRNTKTHRIVFSKGTSCDSWITGLQFPLGLDWTQRNWSYSIKNKGAKISFKVSGTMDCSVIFKGVGKLITINRSFTTNYDIGHFQSDHKYKVY